MRTLSKHLVLSHKEREISRQTFTGILPPPFPPFNEALSNCCLGFVYCGDHCQRLACFTVHSAPDGMHHSVAFKWSLFFWCWMAQMLATCQGDVTARVQACQPCRTCLIGTFVFVLYSRFGMLSLFIIVHVITWRHNSFIKLAGRMLLYDKVCMCSASCYLGGGKKGLQEVGSPEEFFDSWLELPRNVLKSA